MFVLFGFVFVAMMHIYRIVSIYICTHYRVLATLGSVYDLLFLRVGLISALMKHHNYSFLFQMQQFEDKLSKDLDPSSCVVACRFPLPSWEPVATVGIGVDTVWLYKVNKHKDVDGRDSDSSPV